MYGPVRTVVWEGRSREAPPYPDLWHFCDIAISRIDFRFWWKSGHAADVTATAELDPEANISRQSGSLHLSEMTHHPLGVRLVAGEETEGADSLEYRHAAPAHGAAAASPGRPQELGLKREIHDLRHP